MSHTRRYSADVISRILKTASSRARGREESLYNQDVLNALHDLTRLPLSELERIAEEVSGAKGRGFFSVRQQLFLAGTFLTAACIPLFAVWMRF